MASPARFGFEALAAALSVLGAVPGGACGQTCDELFPVRRIDAGGWADDVRVADFNRDGLADLVFTLFYDERALGVALGRGDGRFSPVARVDPGTKATECRIADFTGDGIPDILGTYSGSRTSALLPGAGDGTFGTPLLHDASKVLYSVDAGDFNGDGLPDVAYSESGKQILVFLNRSDGTFGADIATPIRTRIHSLRSGDLDGDGRTDLVGVMVLSSSRWIAIAFGRGDGTFEAPIEIESQDASPWIEDADRDGIADIISNGYDQLNLRRGLGDRRFGEPEPIACCLSSIARAAFVDMDADGVQDVVVTHSPGVSVCRGLGGAAWEDPVTYVAPESGNFAAADFDGDGDGDLVFSDFLPAMVPSKKGILPRGELLAEWDVGYNAWLLHADADGDGAEDMLLRYPGHVVLFFGDGRGGIATTTVVTPASDVVLGASIADADGDGVPDVLIATDVWGRLWVHKGRGDRTFADPEVALGTGYMPRQIAAADFNLDGTPDMATANADMAFDTVSVILGTGGGAFAEQRFVQGGVFHPEVMVVADFDGDGRKDIATGGWNGVGVVMGRGNGTFGAARAYDLGWEVPALIGADFNADGRVDLAAAGAPGEMRAGAVVVLLSNEDGVLDESARIETRSPPGEIAAADMNADGVPDLVVQWGTAVAFGRGDGTFEAPTYYWPLGPTRTIAVADFDGDHAPDLEFYDPQQKGIMLARNSGLCTACRPDCDRSGRLDINDFVCFQAAWRARTPLGDYDLSGRFDVNDFIAFTAAWRGAVIDGVCR